MKEESTIEITLTLPAARALVAAGVASTPQRGHDTPETRECAALLAIVSDRLPDAEALAWERAPKKDADHSCLMGTKMGG